MDSGIAEKPQRGSQTLARGLAALVAVTESPSGLSTHEVAELLSIHRSIAYRLLQTFVDFGFLTRTSDGNYRPGARLATMSDSFLPVLRELAMPSMRRLTDQLSSTVALFIAEGDEAVALMMVEPTNTNLHMSFRAGMRTPMDRGAAAYALAAASPERPGEPEQVGFAREHGYALSHGEIAQGAHGVAAYVPTSVSGLRLCVHLITFDFDIAANAGPDMVAAAVEIGRLIDAA